MEIRPADLGEGFAQTVILRRGKELSNPLFAFHFRQLYGRKTRLSPAVVSSILHKLTAPSPNRFLTSLLSSIAFFSLAYWLFFYTLYHTFYINFFFVPTTARSFLQFAIIGALELALFAVGSTLRLSLWDTRPLQRAILAPLTEEQAADMQQINGGHQEIIVEYASLVHSLVREPHISPVAQPALRDALRCIGEAVYKLTHTYVPTRDIVELDSQIAEVSQKAMRETDPIVHEALLREAEARLQTLVAAKENALILRRNEALRKELSTQIEALRITLPAFYTDTAIDSAQLSRLGESARATATAAMAPLYASTKFDHSAALPVSVGNR